MNPASVVSATQTSSRRWTSAAWPAWVLLTLLPTAAIGFRSRMAPWAFMWVLAFSVFWGCKWQTWWKARLKPDVPSRGRTLAYLFAWPGMDAQAFLDAKRPVEQPRGREWLWASVKTGLGAVAVWAVVRNIRVEFIAGWVGMLGLVFILHFGIFELLSLFWRSLGINAGPIMHSPVQASSLSDFWGRRWNLGFRQLTHDLIFRPLRVRTDAGFALLISFLASGLIHDLVISLPARGGYGLPTVYFLLQGYGILFERSVLGRRLGLGSGVRGWVFTAIWAGGPACILFHPWFVERVMWPFLAAVGAR